MRYNLCHVSSPGKIILHGEHAVVYGKLALASSLNLRTYTIIEHGQDDEIKLTISMCDIQYSFLKASLEECHIKYGILEDFQKNIYNFCQDHVIINGIKGDYEKSSKITKLSLQILNRLDKEISEIESSDGLNIKIDSQIPIGVGLGSSASYCVSLSAAFLIYTKQIPANAINFKPKHLDLINKWGYEAETIIHGKPSGLDNSTSTYGGIISMQHGEMEVLESHKPGLKNMSVLCINTKKSRCTKDLISIVQNRKNLIPVIVEDLLNTIDLITQRCLDILGLVPKNSYLTNGNGFSNKDSSALNLNDAIDYDRLGLLMDVNHDILNALGVGHPSIEDVRLIVKEKSQEMLRPKMTGAGGGGCLFALIPANMDSTIVSNVMEALQSSGYDTFLTQICCPGVLTHHDI